MKVLAEFPALDILREKMGAPLTSWTPQQQEMTKWKPIEKRLTPGNVRKCEPLGPGLPLCYEGHHILLYIKEARRDKETLLYDKQSSPRFHIAECETIEQMRREGRFERYVMTNETSGHFNVEAVDATETFDTELHVCKNCLKALNLTREHSSWPDFSIIDFFRDYETFFSSLPQHTNITAPPGGYTENWRSASTRYKSGKNWTCEDCGVNLSEHKTLLQCHHKNGVTSNNRPENLQALCIECHKRQPRHGHIPVSEQERAVLARLRAEQGIYLTKPA